MAQNPKIKKPFQKTEYTKYTINELRRCMIDPIYFICNYVYVLHPAKGRVKFNLYDYQKNMVRMYQDNRWCITLASRQCGKSETAAAFLLHFALFNPDKTILIAANKLGNAKEIINRIQGIYQELPDWLKCGIDESEWNKTSLSFENGSKIMAQATSANTGRGFSISLLYVDEMAHIGATPESGPNLALQNAFWASILPVLSENGRLICTSTPNGDIDLFANLWRGAIAKTNPFAYLKVNWREVPGRDEKFKEDIIALFGEKKWRQEYEVEFISSAQSLFDSIQLSAAKKLISPVIMEVGEIFNQPFWKRINPNQTYVVGIDPSQGSGGDYSVIEVFEFPSMEQVAEYRTNEDSPATLYSYTKTLLKFLEKNSKFTYWSVENNALGQAIIALYEADTEPLQKAIFMSQEGKDTLGYNSNISTKNKSLITFKELFEHNQMKLNSLVLLTEMNTLIRKDNTYKAQNGATDDCIFATLIVIRIIEDMASFDAHAYDKLYSFQNVNVENWNYEQDPALAGDSDDDYMPFTIG